MANIAQVVNVLQALILTDREKMVLTPTYHVFRMYRVHQGATLLPVDLAAREYVVGQSAVPSLSASASRDGEGGCTCPPSTSTRTPRPRSRRRSRGGPSRPSAGKCSRPPW